MTLFADDPDVYVEYEIKDAEGGENDFTPVVQVTGADDITATWQGDPGPVRTLRVPLVGLDAGGYTLRLIVPGGNDIALPHKVWLR